MSEDCDFRLVESKANRDLSKSSRRKMLRDFRYQIIDRIKSAGFSIDDQNVRVYYEGTLMKIKVSYDNLTDKRGELKHYIALDFYVAEPILPSNRLAITTLIKDTLAGVDHPVKQIECISLDETAAEKWVALTRRVAKSNDVDGLESEKNLIRHLYDLYQLDYQKLLTDNIYKIAARLVTSECQRHRTESVSYVADPIREISNAIVDLNNNDKWHKYWNRFIDVMVYDKTTIEFREALSRFNLLSEKILQHLIPQESSEKRVE